MDGELKKRLQEYGSYIVSEKKKYNNLTDKYMEDNSLDMQAKAFGGFVRRMQEKALEEVIQKFYETFPEIKKDTDPD